VELSFLNKLQYSGYREDYIKKYGYGTSRLEEYHGRCIATEKITKPHSKYTYRIKRFEKKIGKDSLLISSYKIIERATERVLAEKNWVSYRPKMLFHAHEMLTHPECKGKFKTLKITDVLHTGDKQR
jgi:hypothetical protein